MKGQPILIVDDNLINLKLMRVLLTVEGCDVRTATDAEEALAVLETFTPRLILMDIQLPGIDGLILTRRLKTNPKTAQIKIVAITAYAMTVDKGKALAAGCDAYITKPIDTRSLSGFLTGILEEGGVEKVTGKAGAAGTTGMMEPAAGTRSGW